MKRLTTKDTATRKMLQDTPTPDFYALSCENPLLEDDDLNTAGPILSVTPIQDIRISRNIQQHQEPTPGNTYLKNIDALALANRRCGIVGLGNLLVFSPGEGLCGNNTFVNPHLGHYQQDLCSMQRNCVLDVLLNNANSSGLFHGHLMPNKADFLSNTRYWNGDPTH